MELFEILFIAIFILFPILEQVLKRRGSPEGEETGPMAMEPPPDEIDAPSADREPVQASEMVPDDLWAVLTGEQRPSRPEGVRVEEDARLENVEEPEEVPEEVSDWSLAPDPEEAYSLERLDYEPAAHEPVPYEPVERTVPSSEARHRAFHEKVDRPVPRRRRRRSTVGRALGNPETLRHAVILNEVLGTPKGLD